MRLLPVALEALGGGTPSRETVSDSLQLVLHVFSQLCAMLPYVLEALRFLVVVCRGDLVAMQQQMCMW